jgi:hypothetical protein
MMLRWICEVPAAIESEIDMKVRCRMSWLGRRL